MPIEISGDARFVTNSIGITHWSICKSYPNMTSANYLTLTPPSGEVWRVNLMRLFHDAGPYSEFYIYLVSPDGEVLLQHLNSGGGLSIGFETILNYPNATYVNGHWGYPDFFLTQYAYMKILLSPYGGTPSQIHVILLGIKL